VGVCGFHNHRDRDENQHSKKVEKPDDAWRSFFKFFGTEVHRDEFYPFFLFQLFLDWSP